MKDGAIVVWRDLIKYSNLLYMADERAIELLDIMQELVPIKWDFDRVGTFLKWKRTCREMGLIDARDESIITNEMIHGCGGM